jgi:flagellar hook-basal body complex protein FliE
MDMKTAIAMRSYGLSSGLSNGISVQNKAGNSQNAFTLGESGQSQTPMLQTEGKTKDFSSVLSSLAESAVGRINNAEKTAMLGLNNQADAQTVVEAMANAEMTVKTAIAVRDKIVEAYQEILRMPV